ncbi:MAG: T9SS type A sorting domain-containing protein [Ignavibacteriae bacterium]|nr:T9SS type A sorting domain-containing protein [Ignavibacteriota bacterium]
MKKLITLLLMGFGLILFKPSTNFAQDSDTLDIAPLEAINISSIINGDTLQGGVIKNQNRVYRLQRGVIYPLDAPINIRGSFKMIATNGTERPPVLVPKILADNSSIQNYLNLYGAVSNVEFHNIYMLGIRQDGAISNALNSAISVMDSAINLKVRNCVFDGFGARGIRVLEGGVWSKIDVQDSKFRNLIYPGGSWLYGQAFKTVGNTYPLDTVKFVNNTYLSCGSYILGVSGYVNYGLFEHNTILYGIGNTFLSSYNTNIHIKNNIVYSTFTAAGYKPAVYGDWFFPRPDTISSSVIVINIPDTASFRDTTLVMPGLKYIVNEKHGVPASSINDLNRVLEINNNNYFYPEKLTNFINAYNDTVQTMVDITFPGGADKVLNKVEQPRWMNDYTKNILQTKAPIVSPGIKVDEATTYNQDPQFNDVDAVNHVDALIGKLHEIFVNKITPDRWTYKMAYPPAWPLPEDLAYANTSLQTASEGGFPLGDLNWFPEKKAQWQDWLTDVKEEKGAIVSNEFELHQNYPNPFNPTTEIKFSITKPGIVTLKVFDVLGREIATLINNKLSNGSFSVNFNASNLASGTYIYQLSADGVRISKKMMLIK